MKSNDKIILAITGASGAIYAKLLLDKLNALKLKPAVIFSDNAKEISKKELGKNAFEKNKFLEYRNDDFYAPFASGSSEYSKMIICPASMGIIGRIVNGISDDLITRAADVMLKEKRQLILVPREAPYNLIHLDNMKKLTMVGALICPASPSFYSKPDSIEELASTIVDRLLDLMNFEVDTYRWGNEK